MRTIHHIPEKEKGTNIITISNHLAAMRMVRVGGLIRAFCTGAIETRPTRGMRDMPPQSLRMQQWLFGEWRAVAHAFAFEEFDAPVVENQDLYIRKNGEEIVQQVEMYAFEDKSGRKLALRPEMTPSLARVVLAHQHTLSMPIKWYSIPQCFRYERMLRGRRREHYQWNMDIWGIASVSAEVELMAAMCTFFQRVGLSPQDVEICVSDRGIIAELFDSLEIPAENLAPACIIVDKLDKIGAERVTAELSDLGIPSKAIGSVLRILQASSLAELEGHLGASSPSLQRLRSLFDLAQAGYGLGPWLRLDTSIVRGLSYYTGPVFEARDTQKAFRAIAGGGRYDSILETFGAKRTVPAVGFGFGDCVIMELLQEQKRLPEVQRSVEWMVFVMDPPATPCMGTSDALCAYGLRVGRILRARYPDVAVDVVMGDGKNVKWALRHAERSGVRNLVICGSDELEAKCVTVRNMHTRQQELKPLANL